MLLAEPEIATAEMQVGRAEQGEDTWEPNRCEFHVELKPDIPGKVQARLMDSPYLIVPTNAKVKMGGEVAKVLASSVDDLKKKFVFQDWAKINQQRAAWIDRFNREIA